VLRLAATCLAAALGAAEPAASGPAAREVFLRHLAKAPVVAAARERLAAADHAAGAAGRLPDPMLSAGYSRVNDRMARWPMREFGLEQALPRWGERDARRAQATAGRAMADAELAGALGELAAEVAGLLVEAEAARSRLGLVRRQAGRADAIAAAAAARTAAGRGGAAEQLAAASRVAALAVEVAALERLTADAEDAVRARLALAAQAPLPPFAAPDQAAAARERLPPELTARARTAEAEAMRREARAGRFPETAVGVLYGREDQPGGAMTTIGVELRVALPVWQGAAADLERAAAARVRAARHEAEDAVRRAQASWARAQRARAVATRAQAAAAATRARIEAEYQALAHAAATQEDAGLLALLDVLDRVGEAERQVIEAEAAARQAEADLWRLAPPILPESPESPP
jgi:outer membrane protein TolC